jgi:hypothetical protein
MMTKLTHKSPILPPRVSYPILVHTSKLTQESLLPPSKALYHKGFIYLGYLHWS